MLDPDRSLQRQLKAICDDFKDQWSAHDRPDFQSYLDRVAREHQLELLRVLLETDVELRSQAGQDVSPGDYSDLGESAPKLVHDLLAAGSPDYRTLSMEGSSGSDVEAAPRRRLDSVGSQIGPYKLLQQIGEGGMGSVWMAEQEHPVRRRVALKLIRADMGSKETAARFEAERQALAMMDHQNIAKVLDAATTEFGSPYFVMELVKGIPLTKYCDQHKLSIRERLALFIPVCHAVQHAHHKGIIHRDLKPSNVLVTLSDGKPVPKVIDFGLAKALEHTTKLTDKTMFTEFGKVVGTLQYMSPEQAEANALDVDTRTDIYSLGVMLYELLTGSTPLESQTLKRHALHQVLQMIREQEPPRPSTRLSSSGEAAAVISQQRQTALSRLQHILRGDLDWIVMKALEKDRTRRYESARSFADDIERYLNAEAVEARPPSTSYRISKFVNKHRMLVATTAAIALLLIAGITGTSWFAYSAESARQLADAAKDEAFLSNEKLKESNGKLQQALEETRLTIDHYVETVMNDDLLKEEKFRPTLEKLLANAVTHYKQFVDRYQHEEDSLDRVIDSLRQISVISKRSGRMTESLEASNLAIRLLKSRAAATPADPDVQWRLANSLRQSGLVAMTLNNAASAEEALTSANAIFDTLAQPSPSKELRLDHVDLLKLLGSFYTDQNETRKAAEIMSQAAEISSALRTEFPDDMQVREAARDLLLNKAINIAISQGAVAALPAFEQCLQFSSEDLQLDPASEKLRLNKATDLYNLGITLNDAGRPGKALTLQTEAAEVFEGLVKDFPLVKLHQTFLADTYQKLAELHADQKDYEPARQMIARAVEMHRALVARYPDETVLASRMANQLNIWGEVLLAEDQLNEALAKFEEAFDVVLPVAKGNLSQRENQYRYARISKNRGSVNEKLGKQRAALHDLAVTIQVCARFNNLLSFQELMSSAVIGAGFLSAPDRSEVRSEFATIFKLVEPELERHQTLEFQLAVARIAALSGAHANAEKILQAARSGKRELTGAECFFGACVLALAAESAAHDEHLNHEEKSAIAMQYADSAMSLLDSALQAGLFQEKKARSPMEAEPDLQFLVERSDFQEMLEKLARGSD